MADKQGQARLGELLREKQLLSSSFVGGQVASWYLSDDTNDEDTDSQANLEDSQADRKGDWGKGVFYQHFLKNKFASQVSQSSYQKDN